MAIKRHSQVLFFALNALAAICLVASGGCGSNEPSVGGDVPGGTGGGTAADGPGPSGAGGTTPGTGGTTPGTGGTGGEAAGAGAGAGGTGGAAGSTGGTGGEAAGAGAGAGGTGGAAGFTAGTGGEAAGAGGSGGEAAGAGGSGGEAADAGGSGGSEGGEPRCEIYTTAAGEKPAKEVACTESDPQLCYKACGPETGKYIGYKSETCTNGAYVEQSGCTFPPDADYSCYSIPETLDPSCPATVPQATMECTVEPCVPCNLDGNYLTSKSEEKQGYCVCPEGAGTRKWSCASLTAWPCPAGQGC